MSFMFMLCFELEYLDLPNFNITNVTSISSMFCFCTHLKEIKGIEKLHSNRLISMGGMFECCEQLECLDLSNFNTSNVINMSFLFSLCHGLKEIKRLNKFNTSNVKNMSFMFASCSNLKYLDLSNFDTSNVDKMFGIFPGCKKLIFIKGINTFKPNI